MFDGRMNSPPVKEQKQEVHLTLYFVDVYLTAFHSDDNKTNGQVVLKSEYYETSKG